MTEKRQELKLLLLKKREVSIMKKEVKVKKFVFERENDDKSLCCPYG